MIFYLGKHSSVYSMYFALEKNRKLWSCHHKYDKTFTLDVVFSVAVYKSIIMINLSLCLWHYLRILFASGHVCVELHGINAR